MDLQAFTARHSRCLPPPVLPRLSLPLLTLLFACTVGPAPEPPSGVTVRPVTSGVEVRWLPESARSYQTLISWRAEGSDERGSETVAELTASYLVLGLTPGVRYGFSLVTRATDGRESGPTEELFAVPLAPGQSVEPPDAGPPVPDAGAPVDAGYTGPLTPDGGRPATNFVSQPLPALLPVHMRNGLSTADYRLLPGDYDGDGRKDLAMVSPNGGGTWATHVYLELSTDAGVASVGWPAALPGQMRLTPVATRFDVFAADFNGDGRTDLASLSPTAPGAWDSNVFMELSTGAAFTSAPWACGLPTDMRNGGATNDYRVFAVDLNGDKKADLLAVSPNGGGAWVNVAFGCLSTGTGFTRFGWSSNVAVAMRNAATAPLLGADFRLIPGDFNGDGKGDLLAYSPNAPGGWQSSAYVDLSSGTAFTGGAWATPVPALLHAQPAARFVEVSGDFNGDGRTDVAWLSANATGAWRTSVYLDLGAGIQLVPLTAPSSIANRLALGGASAVYRFFAGDVDGLRGDELIALSPDASGAWATTTFVERLSGAQLVTGSWSGAALPEQLRAGGAAARYFISLADVDGDGRADFSAVSPDATGAWATQVLRDLAR